MLVNSSDRQVYRLIEQRQEAALGATSDAHIGDEDGVVTRTGQRYRFVPHPVNPQVPESFSTRRASKAPSEPSAEPAQPSSPSTIVDNGDEDTTEPNVTPDSQQAETTEPSADSASEKDAALRHSASIFSPEDEKKASVFGLSDCLAYANHNARELQEAKEDLYLQALDLTLERHLWTPQFVASIKSEISKGWDGDEDRAWQTISEVSASQRLPFGGEITASVVSTIVHNITQDIRTGESGQINLGANIPLFRGAGLVAMESRFSKERDLVYAVRNFERFRRAFLVNIASDYFSLQQAKAGVVNAHMSYENRYRAWQRAAYLDDLQQSDTVFDAPRARASFLDAEASLVSAKEGYESALDRFKIRVGMPVDALLDVVQQSQDTESQAIEDLLSDVTEIEAIDVAVECRLDLLNSLDQVDDTRRSVSIAKNRILPDLSFESSVTFDTDPEHMSSDGYSTERLAWQSGLRLGIDDRKTERNEYRSSLISLRRAERRHRELVDTVRSDVRRAIRRIAQQDSLREIQGLNVRDNELRYAVAYERFTAGRSTNQDAIDAEEVLLRARNQYAAAVASYRQAILEFRRDTGTLRVNDDGTWTTSLVSDVPEIE